MSDPITDMSRAVESDERYGEFLENVYKYLDKKTLPKEEKAIKLVNSLKLKDKKAWIRVFNDCKSLTKYFLLKQFKEHEKNPFKDKTILDISYGYGFLTMEGNIVEDISSLLHEKGMATFQGDDYSIIIDKKALENAEVIWRRHGSEKTPYIKDRR